MASSSGISSGSGTTSGTSLIQNSGTEENLQVVMNERKKKRMVSNRESARRSRMRKQKHLDDLMAQVTHLRSENHQLLTSLNMTTQHYLTIESDNSILRAQMGELSSRLESLNEISFFLNANNSTVGFETTATTTTDHQNIGFDHNNSLMIPWNSVYMNQQPIMASADMFLY
ncbi:hypothetical protein GIB67_004879 [Kingdonia uniflora]|uniref:BZIP domain-containing protein n=1 Tax=Kingdonia uniflora TaxID=39325 RepID=A0A7J7LNH6_9MAGN|nr:hypothetical protein GIB67_004879 [Kingdonia uniflora]